MSEIELHRKLLGDRVRNQALHAALAQFIEPGVTRVLDIGAGTGFLSLLARRLGAKHCTLVEYSDMLDVAMRIARDNRIDELSFVKAHSGELRHIGRFDLVISETLGNYALEEGLLETVVDAWRFVGNGGRVLPIGLKQFVAPVLTPRLQEEIDIWGTVGYGVDLRAAREVALNNMYVKLVRADDLGGSDRHARQWDAIDLKPAQRAPSSLRRAELRWRASDLGSEVHGFALWWEAELGPGVALSTSPFAPPTHWEQVYLPLLSPLALKSGDALHLQLLSDTRPQTGLRVAWRTRQLRSGRVLAEQQQDIVKGRI